MDRSIVIREGEEGKERVVPEADIREEAALHDVLMRHPTLVPATDLGFGKVVTVGFEASLESGSADLVLLDDEGRLCLVEVKKEGNRDTRRVVAQILDYAAALWGLTVDQFERDVLQRMQGRENTKLRDFVASELAQDTDDQRESEADRIVDRLGDTLRTGDFTLVVAAPTISTGVRRVIEYLNARGFAVFGLEVSYFAGEVEAFVPRVVVGPSLGTTIISQAPRARREVLDRDKLGAILGRGSDAGKAAERILDWAEEEDRLDIRYAKTVCFIEVNGRALVKIWPTSKDDERLEVSIDDFEEHGESWSPEDSADLVQALENIGVDLSGDERWAAAPLEPLADDDRRGKFVALMEKPLAALTQGAAAARVPGGKTSPLQELA